MWLVSDNNKRDNRPYLFYYEISCHIKKITFQQLSDQTRSINVHPATSIRDMDLWKLWPTNQTNKCILMSYEQEASSKLTAAQKEMVKKVREMDKKTKGL